MKLSNSNKQLKHEEENYMQFINYRIKNNRRRREER